MTKSISNDDITDIEDPEFRTRMMLEVIRAVRASDRLHMPLLSLISCFIDGLACGKPGQTKEAYLDYLKKHFPSLCNELGAEVFYSKFRNSAVHEFSVKPGYGIDRSTSMDGKYSKTNDITGTEEQIIALNIDRLVEDFVKHVEELRNGLAPTDQPNHSVERPAAQ